MTERNPIPPTSFIEPRAGYWDAEGAEGRDRVVLTLLVTLQNSCPRVPEYFVSFVLRMFAARQTHSRTALDG